MQLSFYVVATTLIEPFQPHYHIRALCVEAQLFHIHKGRARAPGLNGRNLLNNRAQIPRKREWSPTNLLVNSISPSTN